MLKTPKVRKKMSLKEKEQKAEIRKTETKEERFIRIATPRVKNVIVAIRKVNTCVRSPVYSMTKEQVDSIQTMLIMEVNALMDTFNGRTRTKRKEEIVVIL